MISSPTSIESSLKAAKIERIVELSHGMGLLTVTWALLSTLVVGTCSIFVIKAMEKAQNLRKEEVAEEAPAGPTELKFFKKSKPSREK